MADRNLLVAEIEWKRPGEGLIAFDFAAEPLMPDLLEALLADEFYDIVSKPRE